MSHPIPDVIDDLVGIDPGSALDAIRSRRPDARENAQRSYLALFKPADPGTVTLAERYALAVFVTGLHREPAVAAYYRANLVDAGSYDLLEAVDTEGAAAAAEGPYGTYPAGPLSSEDRSGLAYAVSPDGRIALGDRLAAALEHTHLLVFRPRDASAAALQALRDAGWTASEIVTLSQIVAFLTFQIRVVHGLHVLATAQAETNIGFAAIPIVPVAAL
jgi:CMD domain protein